MDVASGHGSSPAIPIGMCPAATEVEFARSANDDAGRKSRLCRVFEATADGLYRFILVRVGGNRDSADELLQQTCHEAAKSRRLPQDDNECESWLFGVARNLIRKHWRTTGRDRERCTLEDSATARQLAEDMEARPLPEETLSRRETGHQLLLSVTRLPAEEQRLVFAFYFEGRSCAEIADELRLTPKSVEMRLYRVRHRLRSMLRGFERT